MTKFAFNLSTGADTGGSSIRSVEAFREINGLMAAPWVVRSMVASTNYIEYDQDLKYSILGLEMQYDAADVVQLNHTIAGHEWYDANQRKPIVLMHHGLHEGSFRVNFAEAIEQARAIGATQIGSTANLELYGPKGAITWAPIPYNQQKLLEMRISALERLITLPNRPIRIGHAPTNREIKSTGTFIAAIQWLKANKVPVEAVLIEKQPHSVCLERKATCDIYVDQLRLGYGCNAIEAWGMGIPVVGGIEIPSWREHMVSRWGGMPLVEASEANLHEVLFGLVKSADSRAEYREKGSAHFARWHSQAAHVDQMNAIYDEALLRPTRPSPTGHSRRRRMPGQPEELRLERRAERAARLAAQGKLTRT